MSDWIGTSFSVDDIKALTQLSQVSTAIMRTLPGAINQSLRQVRDTIYSDYRRFGSASPSYLNPSKSGAGFTDRTGRLRASLRQDMSISTYKVVGTLSAGMPYDVYVESLWGGKYSFMLPAFVKNEQKIKDNIIEAIVQGLYRIR